MVKVNYIELISFFISFFKYNKKIIILLIRKKYELIFKKK